MAIWKDVKGYEGIYQVSDSGSVKRVEHKRYDRNYILKELHLKPSLDKDGYSYVKLRKGGKSAHKLVHRLVAEAFLENPNQYPVINHKDGCKSNNLVDNLEYCTSSYNTRHAFDNGLIEHYKRKVRCIETGEEYESLKEVTEKTGIPHSHIPCCCRGRRNTAGGYHWEYVECEV